MQLETQRLEDRIAKREVGALSHERMPDLRAHGNYRQKSQETDHSKYLEDLNRRKSLIDDE